MIVGVTTILNACACNVVAAPAMRLCFVADSFLEQSAVPPSVRQSVCLHMLPYFNTDDMAWMLDLWSYDCRCCCDLQL